MRKKGRRQRERVKERENNAESKEFTLKIHYLFDMQNVNSHKITIEGLVLFGQSHLVIIYYLTTMSTCLVVTLSFSIFL